MYFIDHFVEQALLFSILKDHVQIITFFEESIHLQDVWTIQVELQLYLFNYLALHLLFTHQSHVDPLQSEDTTTLLLLNNINLPKSPFPQLPPYLEVLKPPLPNNSPMIIINPSIFIVVNLLKLNLMIILAKSILFLTIVFLCIRSRDILFILHSRCVAIN